MQLFDTAQLFNNGSIYDKGIESGKLFQFKPACLQRQVKANHGYYHDDQSLFSMEKESRMVYPPYLS